MLFTGPNGEACPNDYVTKVPLCSGGAASLYMRPDGNIMVQGLPAGPYNVQITQTINEAEESESEYPIILDSSLADAVRFAYFSETIMLPGELCYMAVVSDLLGNVMATGQYMLTVT